MVAGNSQHVQGAFVPVIVIDRHTPVARFPGVYTVNIPVAAALAPTRSLLPQVRPKPRPLPEALDAEDVDPETWRRVKLLAWKDDEETCEISLLRPLWWIEQMGARVGGLIRLGMPEMGVAGAAKVLSIAPCPNLETGRGEIVTGTFKHTAKFILRIFFEGLDEPLGVTPNHPIFSLDRCEFIAAGSLRVGERLKTRTGVVARIARMVPDPGERHVYNLEVHRAHVFFVTKLGVLVHNTYEFFKDARDALGHGGEEAVMVRGSEVKVRDPGLLQDGFTMRRIYKMPWGEYMHVFFKPGSGWGLAGPSSHME